MNQSSRQRITNEDFLFKGVQGLLAEYQKHMLSQRIKQGMKAKKINLANQHRKSQNI